MWQHLSYSPKYLNDMLKMTASYYGKVEIADENYIQHEYFENPSGDAAIELAYDAENERLAGQYIAIPRRIRIEKNTYPILLSLNTLTDEHYRGQGIFSKLAERLYTSNTPRFIGVYGMPNQNSYPGFIKKLACRDFGRIPLFLRPLKPSSLVRERIHSSALSLLACPFDFFYHVSSYTFPSDITITRICENNLSLVDDFWNRVKDAYPVMIVRDNEYVKWRYLKTPIRKYRVCVAIDSDGPCAFAVGRITSVAEMNCGMLVDFLTLPGCEKAGMSLIQSMLAYFASENADMAGCLMKAETREAKLLKKNRFFICPKFLEPQPFPMILRLFRKDLEDTKVSNFKSWFFTMGDYDVI